MRFWIKIIRDGKRLSDFEIRLDGPDTRTTKVFAALTQACLHYDLAEPVWLNRNVKEFQKNAKTRFRADNFIESIPFDFMEFEVLEEDLPF